MTEKWVHGEVVNVKHWTESLYSVSVSAPEVKFVAGQYTKLSLSLKNEEVARPYSFVNSPDEEFLEFYSVSVPNGPLSTAMQTLKKGDSQSSESQYKEAYSHEPHHLFVHERGVTAIRIGCQWDRTSSRSGPQSIVIAAAK